MPALAGIGGRLALGYLGSCQPCLPIPAVAGIGVFYKFHRGTRVPRHSRVANHVCDLPNKIGRSICTRKRVLQAFGINVLMG